MYVYMYIHIYTNVMQTHIYIDSFITVEKHRDLSLRRLPAGTAHLQTLQCSRETGCL